ncbi:unnamed protein product, partial [Closterium sp. NIES-53]
HASFPPSAPLVPWQGGNSEQDRMSWEQYHRQQQQRGRGGAAGAGGRAGGGAGRGAGAAAGEGSRGEAGPTGEAQGMGMGQGEGEEEELEGTFVWGTGVSVQDVSSKFASFVRHFREADDALHAKYSQQLDEVRFGSGGRGCGGKGRGGLKEAVLGWEGRRSWDGKGGGLGMGRE